jgi:drug/metabolite transporter (DMT)-like permease
LVATLALSERERLLSGLAYGAVGAVLFSAKAIIVKLAYRHGADPVTLIALRMAFALPFFVVVALWQLRTASLPQGRSQSWRRGDVLPVIGLGLIGYYASSFLDFLGLQYISAALERVILYLNPTLVVLISMLVLGKRPTRRELIALPIAYAGMLVVFGHDLHNAPLVRGEGGTGAIAMGAALIVASAFSYAVYLVASGQMVARLGPLRLTAWASIVASVACIGQALWIEPQALLAQAPAVYWLSLVNGVACTVVPVFFVMIAIERLGPAVASQVGMIGPVATIFMAALILGEPIGLLQLAGTAVVLSAVWTLSRRRP